MYRGGMRLVILNGNPDAENRGFDGYVGKLGSLLDRRGHEVTAFTLRDMDIKGCQGCFGCWVRTPGRCVMKDEMSSILTRYVGADVAVLASPVIMGFVSSYLKNVTDRLLPLFCAYLVVKDDGLMGHAWRYEGGTDKVLLLEKGARALDADIDIIEGVYAQTAYGRLLFSRLTTDPAEDVCHAIDGR